MAQYSEGKGRLPPAWNWYVAALRLDRRATLPRYLLGRLSAKMGDLVYAEAVYKQMLHPDEHPAWRWQLLMDLADLSLISRELDDARAYYERILSEPMDELPESEVLRLRAAAYNGLGCLAEVRGDDRSARAFYAEAVLAYPLYPAALWNVSRHVLEEGDAHGAVALLERVTALDRRNREAWLALADGYEAQGRPQDARRARRRATRIRVSSHEDWPYSLMAELGFTGSRADARDPRGLSE